MRSIAVLQAQRLNLGSEDERTTLYRGGADTEFLGDHERFSGVFVREIQITGARQHGRRDDADDGTAEDVERDKSARAGRGKERRCDHRRRAAGEHGRKLEADRRAAVTETRGENLRCRSNVA
jgi:hypothetical protein